MRRRRYHVEDTVSGSCQVRDYTYDANSNRESLTSRAPNPDGTCDTTSAGTVMSSTYDEADRILTTQGQGYDYDALGRITTAPASGSGGAQLTATYHVDDRVRSLTQGSTTKTNATTATHHYADDSDSPAWIAEGDDGSRWTRNITGLDGNLVATQDNQTGVQVAVANLHGDLIGDSGSEGLAAVQLADEFGRPTTPSARRYQWLGAKRRTTALTSGVVVMGQRVYSPTTGRFLQVDPVEGGGATDYDYAYQDPINNFDLAGTVTGCDLSKIALYNMRRTKRLRFTGKWRCPTAAWFGAVSVKLTFQIARYKTILWIIPRHHTVYRMTYNARGKYARHTAFSDHSIGCDPGKRYRLTVTANARYTSPVGGISGHTKESTRKHSNWVTCR